MKWYPWLEDYLKVETYFSQKYPGASTSQHKTMSGSKKSCRSPCIPVFPACVTCCHRATSLDLNQAEWLSRLTQVWSAHQGRISRCPGRLSSLWLTWAKLGRHASAMLTPRIYHIVAKAWLSPRHTSPCLYRMCHKPRSGLRWIHSLQEDTVWLIGRCLCPVSHR